MFATLPLGSLVSSQMDATDKLLKKLEGVLVNPVVAGGAPRDWFFNESCTDIDIFVDPQDIDILKKSLDEILLDSVLLQTGENLPEQYRSNYIVGVFSFKFKLYSFQIVVKNTTEDVLKHFPCSLSLITYSDFTLNPSHPFLRDMYRNQLTFSENCSQRYERKMVKKFPGRFVKYSRNLLRNDHW